MFLMNHLTWWDGMEIGCVIYKSPYQEVHCNLSLTSRISNGEFAAMLVKFWSFHSINVHLMPISAALTLGCTPRRASRSQQNSGPQHYLSSSPQEKANIQKDVPTSDQIYLCPKTFQLKSVKYPKTNHPPISEKIILCKNGFGSTAQPQAPLYPYSVYPLFYGTNFPETKNTVRNFQSLHDWTPQNVQNLENGVSKSNEGRESGFNIKCDLSLRLGPNSVEVLDVRALNSSTEASKCVMREHKETESYRSFHMWKIMLQSRLSCRVIFRRFKEILPWKSRSCCMVPSMWKANCIRLL